MSTELDAIHNTFQRELLCFLKPLALASASDTEAELLLSRLGWQASALPELDKARWSELLQPFVHAAQALAEGHGNNGTQELLDLPRSIFSLFPLLDKELESVAQALPSSAQNAFRALGEDLLHWALVDYLRRYHPVLLHSLRLLTLVQTELDRSDAPVSALVNTNGMLLRAEVILPRIRLDRLSMLLQDPVGILRDAYLGTSPGINLEQAQNLASKIFDRIAPVLVQSGARVAMGSGLVPSKAFDPQRTLAFLFDVYGLNGLVQLGAALSVLSDIEGGAGLGLVPMVVGKAQAELGLWSLAFQANAVPTRVILRRDSVELPTASSGLDVSLIFSRWCAANHPAWVFSFSSTGKLLINQIDAHLYLQANADQWLVEITINLQQGSINLRPPDGDGFLHQVLLEDGMQIDFDLAIGWSNKKGIYFHGGTGLEANLLINKELFNTLKIDSVYFAILVKESNIKLIAATSVTLRLGPVTAAIEQMGLQATLTFPEKSGNLGPVNLEIGFKPPNGAGLVLDASIVVGAGFLKFDVDKQLYYGFLHLEIAEMLNVTAVGLITTRLPDGSPGFSLLALIAVQFSPPIQLGYGFTLNGLGGILGVNRTAAVEVLRSGLRAGTLGSVLFPVDPVNNAMRIVSDLDAVFPPAEGRYLFGPMAILGWGPNSLIKLELGLILELPEPIRLMILGRLRVVLPKEQDAIVKLQLDSLGVINFSTGDVALDAVLYDSEIKGFAITGEMALRANFGAHPEFILSVGGFHPAFKAPSNFPALERVAISLAAGDNPRLRLSAYMAVTTNTIQFGSLLELYAGVSGFSLEGRMNFDALIQLEPFGFVVDIGAMVVIKLDKSVLFCVNLEVNLTGPNTWHAWGEAQFKFLGFNVSIPFNILVGEELVPSLPDPVNLYKKLIAELTENNNWSTVLPPGVHPLVVIREQKNEADQILVHPLADLAINQKVAPLGINITNFGSALLEGGTQQLNLEATETAHSSDLSDWFAPAQYWAMSDDEKLSSDSFMRFKSGIQFAKRGYECGQAIEEADMQYEERVFIDRSRIQVKPAARLKTPKNGALQAPGKSLSYTLDEAFLKQVAPTGAVGVGALQRTGKAKYRAPLEKIIGPVFSIKPRANLEEISHE